MRILFNGIPCFCVRLVIPAHLTHNFLFILSKRNMDSTSKQTDNTAEQQPKQISLSGYFLYSHCINFNYGINERLSPDFGAYSLFFFGCPLVSAAVLLCIVAPITPNPASVVAWESLHTTSQNVVELLLNSAESLQ